MKKLMTLVFALILMLSLAACGGTRDNGTLDNNDEDYIPIEENYDDYDDMNEPPDGNSGNVPNEPVQDIGGTSVNESKDSGNFTVTILSIASKESSPYFKPAAGNKFVFVKVAVKNNGSADSAISSLLHFGDLVDGQKTEFSLNAGAAITELGGSIIDGEVAPGDTREGYYYLEAPVGAKTLELSFNTGFADDSEKITFALNIP